MDDSERARIKAEAQATLGRLGNLKPREHDRFAPDALERWGQQREASAEPVIPGLVFKTFDDAKLPAQPAPEPDISSSAAWNAWAVQVVHNETFPVLQALGEVVRKVEALHEYYTAEITTLQNKFADLEARFHLERAAQAKQIAETMGEIRKILETSLHRDRDMLDLRSARERRGIN